MTLAVDVCGLRVSGLGIRFRTPCELADADDSGKKNMNIDDSDGGSIVLQQVGDGGRENRRAIRTL
jgi:hypothetical protein